MSRDVDGEAVCVGQLF